MEKEGILVSFIIEGFFGLVFVIFLKLRFIVIFRVLKNLVRSGGWFFICYFVVFILDLV